MRAVETAADTVEGRVLPHDLEAERAVLGAILLHPEHWPIVASILTPQDFFRDAHRRIYGAMARLIDAGRPIDFVMLRAELLRTGEFDEIGGPAYLAALIDGIPRATNLSHYAALVREAARLRHLISVATGALSEAYAAEQSAATIADATIRRLDRATMNSEARPVSARAAVDEYAVALDSTSLLPTGFVDLDTLLGGLALGELTIIASRPSMGKTSLGLGIADHLAGLTHPTAVFSLETPRRRVGARLLAWRADVPTIALERGTATVDEWGRVPAAQAALDGLPLYLDDGARTLTEIGAWCRRLRQEHQTLSCAVVDYLQLLIPEGHQASREQEIAAISRGLKRLAQDLGLSVVALSQLSRASEARRDKRPHLSDLRESGCLEQDADLAILLHRPEMYGRKPENVGLAEVIVAKNKGGPTGIVRLYFEARLAQFRNLAQETIG